MKPILVFGLMLAISSRVTMQGAPGFRGQVLVRGVRDSVPDSAPAACVKLVRSEPFAPDEAPLPQYPENAKDAKVEGDVSVHFDVESGCATDEIKIDDGPELLREPVAAAVKNWKYCGVPEGQEIHATIAFRLNCPAK